MWKKIPLTPLFLGLAGVLPFAFLSATKIFGFDTAFGLPTQPTSALYSLVILSFMSGCIWSFSTGKGDYLGCALSTAPTLVGFFLVASTTVNSSFGFVGVVKAFVLLFPLLLILDYRAHQLGQTPDWWMQLRTILTALVVICLLIIAVL